MPDQLTGAHAVATQPGGRRSGRGTAPVVVAGVVAAYAVLAVVAGWLWEWWWKAPVGLVLDGRWSLSGAQLAQDFDGTGTYVVLAAGAGLVLAAGLALVLAHRELAVLAGVVAGSCLAAYLMASVGHALGPADPAGLAREAPDLTKLPGELRLRGRAPWLAFPLGSLSGLLVVWLAFARPGSHRGGSGAADRSREGASHRDQVVGG